MQLPLPQVLVSFAANFGALSTAPTMLSGEDIYPKKSPSLAKKSSRCQQQYQPGEITAAVLLLSWDPQPPNGALFPVLDKLI